MLPRQWLPPGAHARPPARFGRASKSSSTEIGGPTLLVGRGLEITSPRSGVSGVCTTPAGALRRAASGARCSQGPRAFPCLEDHRVVPWRGCAAELAHVDALDVPHDIFPCDVIVPAGMLATVARQELNEISSALYVTPDDEAILAKLAAWEGEIQLVPGLDDVDERDARVWHAFSPIARAQEDVAR